MLKLSSTIFRAYDIRGIVEDTLTTDAAYAIGQVIGSQVLESRQDTLIIGRDGRLSSFSLAQHLSEGVLASGCNVLDIGMVPTPLLYYATNIFDAHSGVMVTGSHNPPNHNGMKIVINGATLVEQAIKNIYKCIMDKKVRTGAGVYNRAQIIERYVNHVVGNVKLLRPLKIVIDAGNGVAGSIAPDLYKKLGCEVYPLFCDVDGSFPHHHPDPSDPANLNALVDAVRAQQADVGLAFDGDGDRLGVVTNQGEIILPDRLLMLYAQSVLSENPHAKIIFDVKCTNHLARFIRSLQGEPVMWKTGHSFIKAKLAETHAALAGEMSGHFFFNDKWYGFDDAAYAGARLLEILSRQDSDCSSLFMKIPNSINTPELKVLIEEEEKFTLMQQLIDKAEFIDAQEIQTIDGIRVDFSDGWGLIRPSNTTPYLILRFEATNETILKNIQSRFKKLMLSVKPNWVLPF